MGSLFEWITDWIKEGLIEAITGQYTGIFESVNSQVSDVASQVGQTPQGWNGGVFSMIQNLSETVVIPIAGIILTFVLVYELIQMILEKNNMLVINALSAADYVLIPVQADYLAAEDMTELIGTVQNVQQHINPKLKIGGAFLTMANDTNFRKGIVKSVKENFGKYLPVLQTVIPSTVRLAEISTADKSIFKHEPRGRAAESYRSLVKEVTEIGNKQRSKSALSR